MLNKYSAVFLTLLLVSAEIVTASNQIVQNLLAKQPRWDGLGTTVDINDYIDETIGMVAPFIQQKGLDPMDLPEVIEGFELKPLLITYSAWLKIHDGSMSGLMNISRDGEQTVSYLANMLRLRLKLKFTSLEIVYKYLVKVMKIGPTGGIKASLDRFSVTVDVIIDFNNDEIQLQKFAITNIGKLRARFTGNILTDWLINPVMNIFLRIFDTIIIKVVESKILDVAYEAIAQINGNIKSVMDALEYYNN